MTKKRELNLKEVQKLRNNGATWQNVANSLGWNMSALRDRLRREGYFEKPEMLTQDDTPKEDNADGVFINWTTAENLLKAGCQVADVAATFGVSAEYFEKRYLASRFSRFSNFTAFLLSCRAAGRCELKEALFNLAKTGDKTATAAFLGGANDAGR